MAAVVTRARDHGYPLYEAANRYAKPRTAWVCDVCANDAARDFSMMGVTPRNTPRTNVGAKLDEAPSRKVIQIELQAIF